MRKEGKIQLARNEGYMSKGVRLRNERLRPGNAVDHIPFLHEERERLSGEIKKWTAAYEVH